MHEFLRELKYGFAALARRPGYTFVAAFTLALGIGSSVAIFTVLNTVVLRPLPYPDPDRIVEIVHHAPGLQMPEVAASLGLVREYRKNAHSLAHVAGYEMRQLNLSGGGDAERLRTAAVTTGLFDVLATRPAIGRPFRESDALRDAPAVVILTDGVWRSRFGGDPSAIGRVVQLDGRSAEVVGVMPRGFAFPDAETRLLVPVLVDETAGFGNLGPVAIGRIAPGATIDAVRREVAQLQQRIPEWFPGMTSELLQRFQWSSSVEPLRNRVISDVSRTLWILFAIVGLVLLVAAANVANLFLVRAESRQREVALRSALGASRTRIAMMFFAESVVLAAIGGAAGLLLAYEGTRLLVAYGPPRLPRLQEVTVDAGVFAFTVALSILSAAVMACVPALNLARRSILAGLHDDTRSSTATRVRHRARQLLVVTQVAMALVLLVSAGLMLRSITRLHAVDPGFNAKGVLIAGLSVSSRTDRANAISLYNRMIDELATVPGVSKVAAASTRPLAATSLTGTGFSIRSRPRLDTGPGLFAMFTGVTADYFEALEAPLAEGRAIARLDVEQNRPVCVVNKAFAGQFLDNRAIGEWIKFGDGDWLEIVGVVADLRTSGLRDEARPTAYLPLTRGIVRLDGLFAIVRTAGDSESMSGSIRRAVSRIDPTVPVTIMTMDEVVSASLAQTIFTVTLLSLAAAIGLTLGLVGLYGAISYIAAQRTREIGVRLALGARPALVCMMVLRQGLVVTSIGILVGLVIAWPSARIMSSLFFGVSAYDPATYAVVILLLVAVSTLATYIPAQRAAAVDPLEALRLDG